MSTFEAIPDGVRRDPDALRAWITTKSTQELVVMAEVGYLNTDALRAIPHPGTTRENPKPPIEINPILAEQVDRELIRRHEHAQLVGGLAALEAANVGVVNFLPGVDDPEAAVKKLAGKDTLDSHVEGDVLYVTGRTSEQIGKALQATRP